MVQADPLEPWLEPCHELGTADQLAKLASLRDQGILTDAEFDAKKAELLARM